MSIDVGGHVYAGRWENVNGRKVFIYMHRQILGLEYGDKREGDHREPLSTLDNRRSNLRVAEHIQNMYNRGKNKNNKSGFKGVSWMERRGKWLAQICANRKQIYIGQYDTREEAAVAYAEAAEVHHGEFVHRSVLCQKKLSPCR